MKNILLIFLLIISSSVYSEEYSVYTFYRNPSLPLIGTIPGCCWDYPGDALSSSSLPFYFNDLTGRTVKHARWVLVWNPSAGISDTGVRLITATDGPIQNSILCEIRRNNTNTPVVDSVDITTEINDLLSNGQYYQILQQTFGNGVNGAKIYGSWIEVVWN